MYYLVFVTAIIALLFVEKTQAHDCKVEFDKNITEDVHSLIFRDPLRRRCRTAVEAMYNEFGQGCSFSIGRSDFDEYTPNRQSALLNYSAYCLPHPSEVNDQIGSIAEKIIKRIVLIKRKKDERPHCVGFITGNRKFITARHCFNKSSGIIYDIKNSQGFHCRARELLELSLVDLIYQDKDGGLGYLEPVKYLTPHTGIYTSNPKKVCEIYKGGANSSIGFSGHESDWVEVEFSNELDIEKGSKYHFQETNDEFDVDQYLFVSYSVAKYFQLRHENPELESNQVLFDSIYFDSSVMCRPYHVSGDIFNHACQSLEFGSGSPIFRIEEIMFDENNNMLPRKFGLAGINIGSAPFSYMCGEKCNGYFDISNIGFNSATSQFTNK